MLHEAVYEDSNEAENTSTLSVGNGTKVSARTAQFHTDRSGLRQAVFGVARSESGRANTFCLADRLYASKIR